MHSEVMSQVTRIGILISIRVLLTLKLPGLAAGVDGSLTVTVA